MPTTVADLKALTWTFTVHADGSDKRGRFSINFYVAELPSGEKIDGWRKSWRSGPGEAGYKFRGATFTRLAEIVDLINKAVDVGDSPEANPE